MAALAVGATASYIPEQDITLEKLLDDAKFLADRYKEETKKGLTEGRIILRSENTRPKVLSTKVLAEIFEAESQGLYDCRECVLGHLQQGETPSPLDRLRATKLAVKAITFVEEIASTLKECSFGKTFTTDPSHCCVVGIKDDCIVCTSLDQCFDEADLKKRSTPNAWWMDCINIIKLLGKRKLD